jgi:hypothetical protein
MISTILGMSLEAFVFLHVVLSLFLVGGFLAVRRFHPQQTRL